MNILLFYWLVFGLMVLGLLVFCLRGEKSAFVLEGECCTQRFTDLVQEDYESFSLQRWLDQSIFVPFYALTFVISGFWLAECGHGAYGLWIVLLALLAAFVDTAENSCQQACLDSVISGSLTQRMLKRCANLTNRKWVVLSAAYLVLSLGLFELDMHQFRFSAVAAGAVAVLLFTGRLFNLANTCICHVSSSGCVVRFGTVFTKTGFLLALATWVILIPALAEWRWWIEPTNYCQGCQHG